MAERKKRRIPRLTTYEEEAAFWDTHSLEEFADELTVVKSIKVQRPLEHQVSVRLDAHTLSELVARAAQIGIRPSTLMRMWILERLCQPEERPSSLTS